MKGPNIVVIGGGTGSFTLLSGLKHYVQNITALVSMADDGGSTGLLRDEFGVLPPGDVRQCLVALSDTPKTRDLFNYRFEEGLLKGHAFGNLFLTALEKMTGSFAEAVELASEVLNIKGRVEPITLTNVTLCMREASGEEVRSEFVIGNRHFMQQRPLMWLEPDALLNPAAGRAIAAADIVVIAPGNLYASLAPALIVPGVGNALAGTKARVVYICNLMTKPGQTPGFKVHDFAEEIERLAGRRILDYVIYNTSAPTTTMLKKYTKGEEFGVAIDKIALGAASYVAIGAPLIAKKANARPHDSDPIADSRTLIRHDSDKVAREIMKLYFA